MHGNGGRPIQTRFWTLNDTNRRHIAAGVLAINGDRRGFESAGPRNIVIATDGPKDMPESRRSATLPFIDRSPIADENQAGFWIDGDAVGIRQPRFWTLQQPRGTLQVLGVFLKGHDRVVILNGQ